MQLLLIITILYVLFALAVMLFQRGLIYIPMRFSPELALRLAKEQGFAPSRNVAGESIGWAMAGNADARASVLVLHGNAGSALNRGYIAQPIRDATAVEVFVLEYPGYGMRAGAPTMTSILNAAEEAFAALPTNRPVYIVAESLGSGPAAHLAKKFGGRVDGILFFAPYNDLASVGQAQMPFLPVRLLLRDRFRPAEWMKEFRGPIKVVLAQNDSVIPARFGQRFHDGYGGPKTIEIIAGAGHNDIAAQSVEWWKDTFEFWRKHQAAN